MNFTQRWLGCLQDPAGSFQKVMGKALYHICHHAKIRVTCSRIERHMAAMWLHTVPGTMQVPLWQWADCIVWVLPVLSRPLHWRLLTARSLDKRDRPCTASAPHRRQMNSAKGDLSSVFCTTESWTTSEIRYSRRPSGYSMHNVPRSLQSDAATGV